MAAKKINSKTPAPPTAPPMSMSKKDSAKLLAAAKLQGDADDALAWLAINLSKLETKNNPSNFISSRMKSLQTDNSYWGKIFKSGRGSGDIRGHMFFFGYQPETQNQMSFWDEFPLVIVIHKTPNYFLGLNLHYLTPQERVTFLGRLLFFVPDERFSADIDLDIILEKMQGGGKNKQGGETWKDAFFDIRYNQLKSRQTLWWYKRCIRRYDFTNVITKMVYIDPMEWRTVPFFPLDRFKGMSRDQIWRLGIKGKTNNR